MTLSKGNKRKVKKVAKGLQKASALHAKQSLTLKKMVRNSRKKS